MKEATQSPIGQSIPRIEGRTKVTGQAEYIHNFQIADMLHVSIHRSTQAHARIVRVDATAALALAGVRAVVTIDDVKRFMPDPYHGPAFHDHPVLADGKVRYIGEPIAVVVADNPHAAECAAGQVVVEYETLPAVFDEIEASKAGAPLVHEVTRPAGTFPDLAHIEKRQATNVMYDAHVRRGDCDKAFAEADHVFEDEYYSQPVTHCPLEPYVSVVEPTTEGLTIHTSTQNPSYIRMEVARLLGWPETRVRVHTAFLGGGFGAKLYIKLEAMAAVCALKLQKPVRLHLTMDEQFYTLMRQACTARIKTAVRKDGRIMAMRFGLWWNAGAYADISPRVAEKSAFVATGPYDVGNIWVDSYNVYTNLTPTGAFRGFGLPQVNWAYECQADHIARTLKMDPIEFRRKNLIHNGRPQATGTKLADTAIPEVLDRIVALTHKRPLDRGMGTIRRGRGIAIALKACLNPTVSVAMVTMCGDGNCIITTGTVDMGQSSDTTMAQIVGEVMGLDPRKLIVTHPDTAMTPYDFGTLGSRSTYHMGNAVKLAAEDVGRQLKDFTAAQWGCNASTLSLGDGGVTAADGRHETYAQVMRGHFGMQAGTVMGSGVCKPSYTRPDAGTGQSDNLTPFWMVGGTGADIEIDTETGRVTVLRLVNVGDVGRAINPAAAERQLQGAAIMQLGSTMTEDLHFVSGQLQNAGLALYKIPAMLDMPHEIINSLVEVPQHDGPYGAKGVGETGTFGVSAAIANAIYDAVGVRIKRLPLTPERVLRALREAMANPMKD